jgi:hypothetical protein
MPWDGALELDKVGGEEFEMDNAWISPHVTQCEVSEVLIRHVAAELDRGGGNFEDSRWAAAILPLYGIPMEGSTFTVL